MHITIQIKTVYGVDKVYPLCEKAHTFCRLLNTKTLTKDALKHIQALGYEIKCAPRYATVAGVFA